jgi:anti-sigma regulatory factor (Ser/Thr protein kinase)
MSQIMEEQAYQPEAGVARAIRRSLRARLSQLKVPEAVTEDTLLVVQELVANVVDHARTPFRLAVRQYDSVLRVTIRDESAEPLELRQASTSSPRGRGLRMIAALSQRWGWITEESGNGKTVWANIPF